MEREIAFQKDSNFCQFIADTDQMNSELCLVECGMERCKPDKPSQTRPRDTYLVHFVLDGRGVLEIGHTTYSLKRGQIFALTPHVQHLYRPDPHMPWHYVWIAFGGTKAAYYLEKAGITPEAPIRKTYVEPERFQFLIDKVLRYSRTSIACELFRTSILYEMMALLVDSQTPKACRESFSYDASPEIYVDSAVKYIQANYDHINVSDVAAHLGISRYYLSHIFKEKLQISPQAYLVQCRMETSAALLRCTQLPIQEIAKRVGYENPMTFSKMFKSVYALSPRNYREKILRETRESEPNSEAK